MKVLLSGICGFVGSTIAIALRQAGHEVLGFDNFIRPGSEQNRLRLKADAIGVSHADIRSSTDIEALQAADWVIDAAANPSVLAGVDGKASSRQVVEHNLSGTVNLLEYCKRHHAGFTLLSTSRVYSIEALAKLPVLARDDAFQLDASAELPGGASAEGISEAFSTAAPVSLYGATKLASETLALEYGEAFDFPVWINRCGVLAGAGQFGRADQGIFSFWINSWLRRQELRYIGFEGRGHQVRDCLHPRDIVPVIERQFKAGAQEALPRLVNLSGGVANSISLAGLSEWCRQRFGDREVAQEKNARRFDIPWMVLDSGKAMKAFDWRPAISLGEILEAIAAHAEANENWLAATAD